MHTHLAQGFGPLGNTYAYQEILVALDVLQADIAMMDMRLSISDSSLNALLSDNSDSGECMALLVSENPWLNELFGEVITIERLSGWMHDALDVLNTREFQIIEERRLMEDGATLEELAPPKNESGIPRPARWKS